MSNYNLTLKKIWGHFKVVNKHRWKVFCLCCKVGIPLQGFTHDMSKYLPIEFFETARYFDEGKFSPIRRCKEVQGYSMAWIHHKNHNKHHYEYWYDYDLEKPEILMPYKYFAEMVCDELAAGIVYDGDDWNDGSQLDYWMKVRKRARVDDRIDEALIEVYTLVKDYGIDKIVNRERLSEIYRKHVGEKNN